MAEVPITTWSFGEPHIHPPQRRHYKDRATGEVNRIVETPSVELPLFCNGVQVGYAEVHLHAARAPDWVEDCSFGFTGRVNTAELQKALGR